jgi:hypothetical protein
MVLEYNGGLIFLRTLFRKNIYLYCGDARRRCLDQGCYDLGRFDLGTMLGEGTNWEKMR